MWPSWAFSGKPPSTDVGPLRGRLLDLPFCWTLVYASAKPLFHSAQNSRCLPRQLHPILLEDEDHVIFIAEHYTVRGVGLVLVRICTMCEACWGPRRVHQVPSLAPSQRCPTAYGGGPRMPREPKHVSHLKTLLLLGLHEHLDGVFPSTLLPAWEKGTFLECWGSSRLPASS